MSSHKKRFLIVVFASLGLAGLGYYAYLANRAPLATPALPGAAAGPAAAGTNAGAGGPPVAVELARVATVTLALDATAVGTLRSNESVVLRPETPGRIAAIDFKDGVAVAKGTLLVALDAATQSAELAQARANLALAEANQKRNQDLFEKKFISQQSLDNTAAALKVQAAAVDLAAAKLAKMRIVAPFAGVIGIRNVSVGDYVKEGQELINLEDIATLKADFRLPESYLGRVRKGQVVELGSDALPGQSFPAVLDAVDPLVDSGGRAISCRARLANPEGKLRPGMFVRVRLIFESREHALMIPEQALVPDNVQPFVFQVVDGKARKTKVRIGLRRNAQVEVLEGLTAGDVIVTAGQLKLRDGAPVRDAVTPPPSVAAPKPEGQAAAKAAS